MNKSTFKPLTSHLFGICQRTISGCSEEKTLKDLLMKSLHGERKSPKLFTFVRMEELSENIDSFITYWKESSDRNYLTMQNLLKSKDFSWALFLGHLVIEKLLKAHYVKKHNIHSVFTHDLLRLARKAELILTDDFEEWLDEISTFNLNARYDNYKQDFYKLCTKEFTELWIVRIETIRIWLIRQL